MSHHPPPAPSRRLLAVVGALAVTTASILSPAVARAEPIGGAPSGAMAVPATQPAGEQPAAEDGEGLFGPLRVGAFAGAGFPRPLSVEGMLKVADVVGLGLEYSLLPNMTVSDVHTSFSAVALDLRVFPMKGGFFVGVAGGHQHLEASTTLSVAGVASVPELVSADTWFVNPRVGFLWTASWGLTFGVDAGVQIPLSASFTNSIPSQLAANQQATNIAHLFGKTVLPTVDLLRVGLLL